MEVRGLVAVVVLDHSRRTSRDIESVKRRSLENADRSDGEPVSTNSQRLVEDDLSGVGLGGVHDRGGQSHVSHGQSAVESSEVNRLVLSVSVEEADLVRVDDRLVLGNNGSVLDEGIGLVQGSGQRDLLGSRRTGEVERQLDVDDRNVHQSGLGQVGDIGVSESVSLAEAGQLSEGRSDREHSQELSEDSTLILNMVEIGRIEEGPVLLVDDSEESGDTVVLAVASGEVSTLSQVQNGLVQLDLASVSLDDVGDGSVISEVLERVRIVGDVMSQLKLGIELARGDTRLKVEVGVSQISLTSGQNHTSNVGVQHSLLDVLNLRKEEHGQNRVDRDIHVVLLSVVGTSQSLSSAVSVVEHLVLHVSVEDQSLVIHHLQLIELGVILGIESEHLSSLLGVTEELGHRRVLHLTHESELTVDITLEHVVNEDLLFALRHIVLAGVLHSLLN